METLYWFFQYVWVLVAYIFIMYIWPSVVFRKHLAGKSRTYRFSFCTVCMIVLINLVCIALGLPHLLYNWLYRLIFYGVFIFFLLKGKRISRDTIKKFKNLVSGTYGPKSMFSDIFEFLKNKVKKTWQRFTKGMKGYWFEYIVLAIIIIFGMTYFSYGAFQDYSFGCGDIYTHTQWTYQLTNNNIFSSGIYPEAMHFFAYSMMSLLGVPLYSVMIFTGCITTFVIFVSAYILFRELFRWRYSPIIVLALFLIIDIKSVETLYSICRLQWSLPQEFGFPAMFLCAAYLIRFLRFSIVGKKKIVSETDVVSRPQKKFKFKLPFWITDENLFIFTMAMAATIVIHFYATVMAFFLCIVVTLVLIRNLFSVKILHLFKSVIAGLMIAIVPFVVCFVSGIWLQGSLYWALSLFVPASSETEIVEEEDEDEDPKEKGETNEIEDDAIAYNNSNNNYSFNRTMATNTGEKTSKLALLSTTFFEKISSIPSILLAQGYSGIEGTRGTTIFVFTMIAIILWLVLTIAGYIYKFVLKKKKNALNIQVGSYIGYLMLALMGIVFHLFYCSGALGLPWIMEPYRICSVAVMLGLATFVVPVDVIFGILGDRVKFRIPEIVVVCLIGGIYFGSKLLDSFHGYLLYQTTRYNSAVMVTKQIVNTLPEESFTIVSTTDELYQIIGKSYHEELIQFINESEVVSYTIPTEFIFIYVEKNPLLRSQYHFFVGPDWLAEEKYKNYYYGMESEGDELRKQTISEEYANVFFGKFPASADVYAVLWERVLLNSKVYVWCQKFNAMYPNELHIYYEDDNFLCYYLHQNPRNLYELATMDPSVMVPADSYDKPIWPKDYKNLMLDE